MFGRTWTVCGIVGSLIPVFAPLVLADDPPPCAEVTDEALVDEAGFYILGNQVWLERNDVTGLQRQSCTRTDSVVVGADTYVTSF